MDSILQFVLQHGYFILAAVIFAHQIGVPLPGPLFLIAGGALAAAGNLNLSVCIGLAVTACVLADWLWYEAGRRGGDRILYFIHSLTRNPEVHNRRAKAVFTRYELPIFLIAKFVPGLDALSPPPSPGSRVPAGFISWHVTQRVPPFIPAPMPDWVLPSATT